MDYKIEISRLSNKFYQDYPLSVYPEILSKEARSYVCLTIKIRDYYICIPYRSNVDHKYSYRFKYSKRSKKKKSGLDYRKIVIIKNEVYFEKSFAIVDTDEHRETMMNIKKIVSSAEKFVDEYIAHTKNIKLLDSEEFDRRYTVSALQYFHKELGI